MANYAQHLNPSTTPQSRPLPGKQMQKNAAGGYVFEIDDWQRLKRFLILGSDGGTFYESEQKLTVENANALRRCLDVDAKRAIDMIVEISDKGLAPKNDPAVFALACASHWAKSPADRTYAFAALPKVCRIGTHLFQFVEARQQIGGGWGRGMRAAIGKWYERPDVINQALKYAQRNGWSHRDVLRLAHPITESDKSKLVFDAICRPEKWSAVADPLVEGWLKIQSAANATEAATLITQYELPRELVPTQFLSSAAVLWALLPHMGLTAMIRNLGNMSKAGLLVPLSESLKIVREKLTDPNQIKRSRVHPFAILLAARTYGAGHGYRSDATWTIVPQVIEALDGAFDLSFGNVTPTGKRFVLGVDVSSSMGSQIAGSPMSSAEAAAAMALITARTEPNYFIMGFATQFRDLGITAKDTLPSVLQKTTNQNFGGTDTSVAVRWALESKVNADVFVIYTDCETWAGNQHTCESVRSYRRETGIDTKLAVVAFTGTNRTVADGGDHNSMDFVGLDASLPQALSAFVEI